LHDAAVNDHVAVVKLLLDSGASVTAANKQKYTPIDVASNPEVVAVLKAAGAVPIDAAAEAATTAAASSVAASAGAAIPADVTPDLTVASPDRDEQASLVREVFGAHPDLDFLNPAASEVYAELRKDGELTIKTGKTDPALTVHGILKRISERVYLDGADGWARLLADAIIVTNNGEAYFRAQWEGSWTANRSAVGKLRAEIKKRFAPLGTPSAGRQRSKPTRTTATSRHQSPTAGAAAAASPGTRDPFSELDEQGDELVSMRNDLTHIETQFGGMRGEKLNITAELDAGRDEKHKAVNAAKEEQAAAKQALEDANAKVADEVATLAKHDEETRMLELVAELRRDEAKVKATKAKLARQLCEMGGVKVKAERDMFREWGGHDNAGSPAKRPRTDLPADLSECCVCHDAPSRMTCMPCGHQCVCKAEDCKEKTGNEGKCPYCKVALDGLESTAKQRAAGKRPSMG
jgi:hypothetical protein